MSKQGRKEWVLTSLFTGSVLLQLDRNLEVGRNSLFYTNSLKGSFSCRKTIDSPPHCCTFIEQLGQPACGDPAESCTCKLTRNPYGAGG